MKMQVVRFSTIIVFWLLVIGCDGGSDENQNALMVETLQGIYDLNLDATMSDLDDEDFFTVNSVMLEIGDHTETITITAEGMRPFTLAGTTLTITGNDGDPADLQVTLSDNGNTLTLTFVDEDGVTSVFVLMRREGTGTSNEVTVDNLQGTYDLDVANTMVEGLDLISGELEITGNMARLSATVSQTGSFALIGNTVTVTDNDGDMTDFQVTLSDDGSTLTLVDEDNDPFVFERR